MKKRWNERENEGVWSFGNIVKLKFCKSTFQATKAQRHKESRSSDAGGYGSSCFLGTSENPSGNVETKSSFCLCKGKKL